MLTRFIENPLLTPESLPPSHPGVQIECLLNPGAFEFLGKIWLIIRVAERPVQKQDIVSFPVLTGKVMNIIEISKSHEELLANDPRKFTFEGTGYLTTLSHLRLVCSDDGIHFSEPEGYPPLFGESELESYGIEDCRVTRMGNTYYLTYTAVSSFGVGVGLRTTENWKDFTHHGMIMSPHNKDMAIFEEKISGKYFALHRPSSILIGGNYIWLAQSHDSLHWGEHKCLITTRRGSWDSARVGAGAAPVKTPKGWLEIYHGANELHHYCLGALLLDLEDPSKIIARSELPLMVAEAPYEQAGFFGQVVFTNGHIVKGDEITIYYGAADTVVCGARISISEILASLRV